MIKRVTGTMVFGRRENRMSFGRAAVRMERMQIPSAVLSAFCQCMNPPLTIHLPPCEQCEESVWVSLAHFRLTLN
jgi:hypothetical protein